MTFVHVGAQLASARGSNVRRRIGLNAGGGAAGADATVEPTPEIGAAIASLFAEVARLRDEQDGALGFGSDSHKPADEEPLLSVVDRHALVRELSRSMALTRRYGTPYTLVYFIVGDMKHVIDLFGLAAGDAVREHVAATLATRTRRTDVVGRLGGDEFAVILGQADEPTGRTKAKSLADQIGAHPVQWNGSEIFVATTFGARTLSERENSLAAIDATDRALRDMSRLRATSAV